MKQGQKQPQIPFGNDNQMKQRQKQIPFGDDKKKDNSESN
jgi:hypothetical protein